MASNLPPLSYFVQGAAKAPKGERTAWRRGLYRARHMAIVAELQQAGVKLRPECVKTIKNMK